MPGLWRNEDGERTQKYLVLRRDNTVPEWPYFVLAAADPASSFALRSYAQFAELIGMDPEYVKDIRKLATEFDQWRQDHQQGDPDAPKHREDDPEVVARIP